MIFMEGLIIGKLPGNKNYMVSQESRTEVKVNPVGKHI